MPERPPKREWPEPIPEPEPSPKLISDVQNAIRAQDADAVMEALKRLDRYLTEAKIGTFADFPDASLPHVRKEVEKFLKDIREKDWEENSLEPTIIIYLGDGGYSRLAIDFHEDGTIRIRPTSNCTPRVKERWEKLIKKD